MDKHPRVEFCIQQVMDQHPCTSPRALATYYEAVHQELAPLARELERESARQRAALENIRLYAARHRREAWAQEVLRFCADAGACGSPLRVGK